MIFQSGPAPTPDTGGLLGELRLATLGLLHERVWIRTIDGRQHHRNAAAGVMEAARWTCAGISAGRDTVVFNSQTLILLPRRGRHSAECGLSQPGDHEVPDVLISLGEIMRFRTPVSLSEKMAAIGQLAAGVAHEINSAIGCVHSNLGTLQTRVRGILSPIHACDELAGAMRVRRRRCCRRWSTPTRRSTAASWSKARWRGWRRLGVLRREFGSDRAVTAVIRGVRCDAAE